MPHDDPGAHLDEVLIGGRERRPIVIVDYDARWPERFELERARISGALGGTPLRIEHFGSTAVPGLAAKPIIDVLVTVADPDHEADFTPQLEAAGYELRVREPRHRMFRTPERDVHVHVWADGDPEVARHLAFRDLLRASASDRAEYERLKRELSRRDWEDMNHYADAKTPLIDKLLARASGPSRWPRG
ncbi:MAG TPA: GrpB family protein [Thermoleophilaceae bacterium]